MWVVVLNWNRPQLTLNCLDSLEQLETQATVVVVDNGSTDGSPDLIRERYPSLEQVSTGENLGYAGGNNVGIRLALAAGAEWVWLLNNDTVVERDTLDELLAAATTGAASAVASRQLNAADGADQTIVLNRRRGARRPAGSKYRPVRCIGCSRGFHEAEIVSGPSLLIRAEALREVGLLDERYFHFYEEVDLLQRMRREGLGVGLACRAVVHHVGGASLPDSAQAHYYAVRNQLLYRRRFEGIGRTRTVVNVATALRLGDAIRLREPRLALAGALAVADAARMRTGRRDLGPPYQRRLRRRAAPSLAGAIPA